MKIIKVPIIRVPLDSTNYACHEINIKKILVEYYPLLAILIGYLLVAFSIGPYQNGDTAWEYEAVSGVLKYGLPYAYGLNLIDQPPLGFYLQATFFTAFGASINNGTFFVTLFGLGCVALVFFIGKIAYNKTTGFFAALLFAFTPWNILISRSFLIDVPCLFFSLLAILIGLIAVKRGSLGFFVVSGIAFALAFNTKLYAAFALIPIIAMLLHFRSRRIKSLLVWLLVFSIPVMIGSFLWYETIAGIGLISIFRHADFLTQNPSPIAPTYFFATNFLVSYGLGWVFIDAILFSLIISLVYRRLWRNFFTFDIISVSVIVCVIGVNTILGASLDLKSPFLNAFKYDYQALPFFCFLAGSLISKGLTLINLSEQKTKGIKQGLIALGLLGVFLLIATLYYNFDRTLLFSTWDYFIFRVEPSVDAGYSLFNSTPKIQNNLYILIQLVGFTIAFSGLFWIGRNKFLSKASTVKSLLKTRHTLKPDNNKIINS